MPEHVIFRGRFSDPLPFRQRQGRGVAYQMLLELGSCVTPDPLPFPSSWGYSPTHKINRAPYHISIFSLQGSD